MCFFIYVRPHPFLPSKTAYIVIIRDLIHSHTYIHIQHKNFWRINYTEVFFYGIKIASQPYIGMELEKRCMHKYIDMQEVISISSIHWSFLHTVQYNINTVAIPLFVDSQWQFINICVLSEWFSLIYVRIYL